MLRSTEGTERCNGAEEVLRCCSTCGAVKPTSDFTKNRNQTSGYMGYCKSCNNERNKRYRRNPENLTRACKRVFAYIQRRVRVKGMELDFDSGFIEDLYNLQGGFCAYTGDKLSLEAGLSSTLSVDRVDSGIGYTKKNVKLVTWEVNNMKQDLGMGKFMLLCKKVLDHGED